MSEYTVRATTSTPALLIFLIDSSASMQVAMKGLSRIRLVKSCLEYLIDTMVIRSTKGSQVQPRYKIAIYQYGEKVVRRCDVTGIDRISQMKLPDFPLLRMTDSALAFLEAEKLLKRELPNLANAPAPIIYHITDGEATGEDPVPVARRIMRMSVPDGQVLIFNISLAKEMMNAVPGELRTWQGFDGKTKLGGDYTEHLRKMSSRLPETYRERLKEEGYNFKPDTLLLAPGIHEDLWTMGLVSSATTRYR